MLFPQLNHLGLVDAERLFGEEVAGGGEGAGAAAHANVAELAAAALPFQVVGLAPLAEDFGVVPDIGEGLLAQVAGDDWQISARKNFAFVRDKTDARSGEAAFGHGI